MVKVSDQHYCFCEECQNVLTYDQDDVKSGMFGTKIIICPNCGNYICI